MAAGRHARRRQPLGGAGRPARDRRHRLQGAGPPRAQPRPPHPRDHRDGAHRGSRRGRAHARRTRRAGRAHRPRRLRHGLLLAELAQALPARADQARPLVHRRPARGDARRGDRGVGGRDGALAGARDGRRGRRDRAAARAPQGARLRVRAGLPLLAAGARRRARAHVRGRLSSGAGEAACVAAFPCNDLRQKQAKEAAVRHPRTIHARRLRLVVGASVLAAVAAAGCGGGKKEESNAPPPRTIVSRSVERTSALKSFHFMLKVENAPSGAPGLTITFAEGDLQVPGRLRARVNGTFGRAPVQTQIVAVGNKTVLQDPLSKKWRPFATGSNPAELVKEVPTVVKQATGLANAGSEKVGGDDTYKVTGKIKASVVAPILAVQPGSKLVPFTIWVGKKDYYLRRARLEGPVAQNEPTDITRTIELSKFNEALNITLPPGSS
ncbi:MAG: LppX_LprAFG lipoprotein [Actinobacteria bacterium]|nr:MAG: LppX_LprAFG lipoprotein [Actinomycetota bacterium]